MPRDVVEERLQDLVKGPTATASEAWHRLRLGIFHWKIGELGVLQEERLDRGSTTLRLITPPIIGALFHIEHQGYGDEATVQARFQNNVGHPMAANCNMSIDYYYSDLASGQSNYMFRSPSGASHYTSLASVPMSSVLHGF